MARKKTIGQAREVAKQSANFFDIKFAVIVEHCGDTPRVARLNEVPPGLPQRCASFEVFEPAQERPNELDERELAAVRAGLYLLTKYAADLPAHGDSDVEALVTGSYKHNRLAIAELERLTARLMVTR